MGPGLLSPTVYELAYQIKYKSENSSSLLGNVFQLLVHDLPSDTARWACALAFAKYILTENENLRAYNVLTQLGVEENPAPNCVGPLTLFYELNNRAR